MDTIGIDIGTVSVKYVRLRGKGDNAPVVSKGIYPYGGDPSQLEFILSDIRGREGNRRVAVGISSQDIIKKSVTIPILPREEVREALDWTASKTIAAPLEDMVFDYIMLGEVEERGVKKEEAYFVGSQKAFVDSLLESFRKSGFGNIILVTDVGLAYQGAMAVRRGGSAALIDIGGTQSVVYLFEGRKMRLVRELLIAAESPSDPLITGIDLHSKERAALMDKGFHDGTVGLSDSSFEKLTGEIQRTFSVFEKRYPDKPLKRIYVAGRGSQIPDFLPRLAERFGDKVRILEPRKDIKDTVLAAFLPALLLAAHPEMPVNLLPEDIRRREKEKVYRKWIAYGGAGVAAVLLIVSLDMAARFNRLGVTGHVETANVERLREQIRVLSSAALTTRYQDLAPFIKEIQAKDETFVTLLKYLSSRLPKGIYLKTIEYGQEKLPPPAPALPEKPRPEAAPAPSNTAGAHVKPGPAPPAGPGPAPRETPRGRLLVIKGYAFGEVDVADPALLDFVIRLGETGMVDGVEVLDRQARVIKGKRVIEFTLSGRCVPHET